MKFRQSFIKSIQEGVASGEITRAEAVQLRLMSWNPSRLREIQTKCDEEVLSQGLAASREAIDWDKLINLLVQLLPVILAFFK